VLVDGLKPHLLSASVGTTAGKSFAARLFAEELRMHTDHLRAFDHKIIQLLDHHPDAPIFLSFTGIGPVVAATLIAEMGEDRTRFPTAAGVVGRDRSGASHQGIRENPQGGPIPLRREPADAACHRLVDVHRRSRRPLVQEHL
jgi:transposase